MGTALRNVNRRSLFGGKFPAVKSSEGRSDFPFLFSAPSSLFRKVRFVAVVYC